MSEPWSACKATKTLSAMLGVNHLGESGRIIFSALEEALAQGRDLGASEVMRREKRIAALEARLAEVGPVVEAAERQETAERVGAYLSDNEADRLEAGMAFDRATHETNNAVRVMRAARSLRGAGEGGRT